MWRSDVFRGLCLLCPLLLLSKHLLLQESLLILLHLRDNAHVSYTHMGQWIPLC